MNLSDAAHVFRMSIRRFDIQPKSKLSLLQNIRQKLLVIFILNWELGLSDISVLWFVCRLPEYSAVMFPVPLSWSVCRSILRCLFSYLVYRQPQKKYLESKCDFLTKSRPCLGFRNVFTPKCSTFILPPFETRYVQSNFPLLSLKSNLGKLHMTQKSFWFRAAVMFLSL